jgi:hypothetical protein
MRTKMFLSIIMLGFSSLVYTSCQKAQARYIDLTTGEPVELIEDSETGLLVDAETKKPVRLYVDTKKQDTIFGPTGAVVDNQVRRLKSNDMYVYVNDPEFKEELERDGDYKLKIGEDGYKEKVEADGDYKIKYGDDYKVKSSKRQYKIKRGDYKKEVERDGDIKIKDGNKKIKIDGETGERKVKYDD